MNYHSDHLGSSRLLTSGDGYPVYQSTFLPYGYEVNPQLPTNTYKFTGLERDAETGPGNELDHAFFRQYSPRLGRWMSPDPAGLAAVDMSNPQTWNRYAYVMGDPVNYFDPLGLCPPFALPGHCTSSMTSPSASLWRQLTTQSTTVEECGWANDNWTCSQITVGGVIGNSKNSNPDLIQVDPPGDTGDSEWQKAKRIRCAQGALFKGILDGAQDFIGIPRGALGATADFFLDPSDLKAAATDVAKQGIVAFESNPAFRAFVLVNIERLAGQMATRFAVRAVPVVGWVLTGYSAFHATKVGWETYKDSFDQCLRDPRS